MKAAADMPSSFVAPTVGEQQLVDVQPADESSPQLHITSSSPINSTFTDNNSMSLAPDDSDDVWSDAREAIDTEDDSNLLHQSSGARGDNTTNPNLITVSESVSEVVGQKETVVESIKNSTPEIGTVLEPRTPVEAADSTRSHVDAERATSLPPSLIQPMPALPTTPSVQYSASLDVPSAASRSISPSPTHQSSTSLDRRQSRRRSTLMALDNRPTNRFSSLISILMHRRPERDREQTPSSSNRPSTHDGVESATPKRDSSSRASSPTRPPRSSTPPPSLPAPSLQELGLSLTAITSILTPSHFSTPPSSGTFLAPHYLLLCHTQGLDVLPLVAPPAPQPYALIRRVSFKSVVVMEEKGVLVAIAGRRDGVRVYALEEVKKAVEWRVDVEIRRERERQRREEAKRGTAGGVDRVFSELPAKGERSAKTSISSSPTTPTPSSKITKRRKSSVGTIASSTSTIPRPRPPTTPRRRRRSSKEIQPQNTLPLDPPPYQNEHSPRVNTRPELDTQASEISVSQTRSRSGSVPNVVTGPAARKRGANAPPRDDEKGEWEHYSSDEEAINMVSAGASGSAALDERTSVMTAVAPSSNNASMSGDRVQPSSALDVSVGPARRPSTTSLTSPTATRRNRPAQLDLTLSRSVTSASATRPPPSPTPSVWTLRQALSASPPTERPPREPASEGEEEEDGDSEAISFVQALMESRLPDLPPPGSQQPQEPIFITANESEPQSPRETVASGSNDSTRNQARPDTPASRRTIGETIPEHPTHTLNRSESFDAISSSNRRSSVRAQTSRSRPGTAGSMPAAPATPIITPSASTMPSHHHRFLPKIITNAFSSRRSDDQLSPGSKSFAGDSSKSGNASAPLPPAPKLEYVKLPGTKGTVMIKAVETAKKSFLAILCGDNGEKVELFAGTYKTTLGLSRTFILPGSPRSLELQLQGDDLVEVFLVFAQNVFGLEPATVRVREVRVGRAERRAARRRARETRAEELVSTEINVPALGDNEATDATVSVGVTLTASATSQTFDENTLTPPPISRQPSMSNINNSEVTQPIISSSQTDELATLATAHLAPYTTFQQLSFAPQFPLATIADECIIPPTYQTFLEYRAQYEPEPEGTNNLDLANVQFSPPGLPLPSVVPPSKWFYRDPKGVVQGPWKASLMHTWYKDGLLPPDLPVRREEDAGYILLKDLRAQSVDPSHPFRSPPPPFKNLTFPSEPIRPLLEPISLLTQHKRYGPPALFFTTRGGHSTTIVDARGRSVLKGRLQWSLDEDEDFSAYGNRLGDVKRLEAFDVGNTAVIAAVRQGGLEVIDVGDALMSPGDQSRSILSNFKPHPSTVSRRNNFIWRVGSPLTAFATGPISSDESFVKRTPGKKSSLSYGRSPAKSEFALGNADDYEGRQHEELLFLGRVGENVYFCERSNGSFRILRLCPISS